MTSVAGSISSPKVSSSPKSPLAPTPDAELSVEVVAKGDVALAETHQQRMERLAQAIHSGNFQVDAADLARSIVSANILTRRGTGSD